MKVISKKGTQDKNKIKYYADKPNNAKPCNDSNPHIVYSKKGNMIVARKDGHAITRNSSFFRRL